MSSLSAPASDRSRIGVSPVTLVVKLPEGGAKLQLRQDVRRTLGDGWTVARLFETDVSKPELMRWFQVGGSLRVAGLSATQAAWEAAHRLASAGDYEIEPQVPKTTYQPSRPAVRSGGARPHLPGSSSKTWALEKAGVLDAWKLAPPPGGRKHGAGVVIGHPDTGYTRHREIYPTALDLQLDRDVLEGDDDAEDPMLEGSRGHGTSTGTVIASRATREVTGTAPAATLRPIRSIVDVVVIFGGPVARAIDYARRSGADVISMSLGGLFLGGVRDAVNAAVEDGCIVMAAAGNVWPWVAEPANYPACIAVAAVNANDAKWVDSASGHQVAISAPGESVWTAVWIDGTQKVKRSSGTSYAVAHIAGIAALWLAFHGGPATLRAKYGRLTSAAFRRVLTSTARTPAGWDASSMGAGIVDAHALLQASLPEATELGAAGPARARAIPTGRTMLREVTTPATYRRLRRALERPVPQTEPPSGTAEPMVARDLLYRELVYLATEQPTTVRSMGRPTARGPEAPAALSIRAAASPSLAAWLLPSD